MSITDGQQALIRRIVTMTTSANIILPNGPQGASVPRYVVQVSGGGQRNRFVRGTTEARPEITVRVETLDGEYTTESDALVKSLVGRFAVGGAPFDGVKILDAPLVQPPLPATQGLYVVPVVIRGFTTF